MSKSLFNVRSRPSGDEDGDTGSIKARASNYPSRSLKVHNHGEGPYRDHHLVESSYYYFCFHI